MRWQKAIIAGAFALASCETNEAVDLVEVTPTDLAGGYELLTIGGVAPGALDDQYCIASMLMMEASGDFEIRHHFVERVAVGTSEACRTDPLRDVFDVYWRGEFENTSTLVVMTILESEVAWVGGTAVNEERTELVGEFDPEDDRLVVLFPDIWSFDPHGASGGKISTGGDARGLGGGTLVFGRASTLQSLDDFVR